MIAMPSLMTNILTGSNQRFRLQKIKSHRIISHLLGKERSNCWHSNFISLERDGKLQIG
jgi:hypothetical protein